MHVSRSPRTSWRICHPCDPRIFARDSKGNSVDQLINQVRGFSFGSMTYEKGGLFGPILRPYLAVIVVESGSCTMRSDLASVTVKPGQTAILAGRSRFEFAYTRGQSTTVSWCEGFLPDLPEPLFRSQFERFAPLAASDRLKKLQKIGVETGHTSSADLNSLRDAVGLAVCRTYLLDARLSLSEKKLPKKVLEAKRFMEEHISDETLDVNSMAAHAVMSPQHFIASFKASVGTTPGKFLWQMRSARARQLLVHTGLGQAQIAYECGYKSVSHFSRSLKKQYGATPSQIRREQGFVQASDKDSSVTDLIFD